MRPVLHGDVTTAARALYPLKPQARRAALSRWLAEARAAHCHVLRFGRAHPQWGTGSLMSRAGRQQPVPEPALSDPHYLECLGLVLQGLREMT